MNTIREFDTWNEMKKKIELNQKNIKRFPKEAEVWISNLGKNVGYEQNGIGESFHRPVLIIKKFNNLMFWVVPLSTKQKVISFYFNYTEPSNQKVSAILTQMKLISIKRLKRKMYTLSDQLFRDIKDKLRSFI